MEAKKDSNSNKVPLDRGKTSDKQRKCPTKSPVRPGPYKPPMPKSNGPMPLNKDRFSKFTFSEFIHPHNYSRKADNKQTTKGLKSVQSSWNLSASDLSDTLDMPQDISKAMLKTKGILALNAPGKPKDHQKTFVLPPPIREKSSASPTHRATAGNSKSKEFSSKKKTTDAADQGMSSNNLNKSKSNELREQFTDEIKAIASLKSNTHNSKGEINHVKPVETMLNISPETEGTAAPKASTNSGQKPIKGLDTRNAAEVNKDSLIKPKQKMDTTIKANVNDKKDTPTTTPHQGVAEEATPVETTDAAQAEVGKVNQSETSEANLMEFNEAAQSEATGPAQVAGAAQMEEGEAASSRQNEVETPSGVGPNGLSNSANAQRTSESQVSEFLRSLRDTEDSDNGMDLEDTPAREYMTLIQFKEEDRHILKCPVELYEQIEKSDLSRDITDMRVNYPRGLLIITTESEQEALHIVQMNKLGDLEVEGRWARSDGTNCGVIGQIPCPSIKEIMDRKKEVYKAALRQSGTPVNSIEWIKKNIWTAGERGYRTQMTGFLKLEFTGEVPKYVYLGRVRYEVKDYVADTLQCWNCQKLGHISKNCKSQPACVRCGTKGHRKRENRCGNRRVCCANCREGHPASYRGCMVFLSE